MSRVFVNSLHQLVTNERLRDVFSQKGEITDVQLIRTSEGRSRQFGFIGFRTEHEAEEAIKYLDNSYIDASKISVEIARKIGDKNAPRPWSRHSLKKERKFKKNGEKPSSVILTKRGKKINKEPEADDPLFQQYLDVAQRGKSKFWSDDMWIAPTAQVTSKEKVLVKKADEPMASNGAERKRSSDTTEKTRKKKVVAPSDDVSDMEDLKSRTKKNLYGDSDDQHEAGRLFVCNLDYRATEEELMEHFSKFGEITEARLLVDKEIKRSKGIAFIRYPIAESAARAMEELDKSDFQGRVLHVEPAKHRVKKVNDTSHLPKTFKQNREEQRKASEAGGNRKAWNSLFMSSDTILENMVRVYGVSKSELLDRDSENPAVDLALAETRVIAETKEALAKAGVNVTSLEAFATGKGDEKNRSKRILLVKNLPFASTERELAQKFGNFGSLEKIILPPTKTMALVVFLEPAEARAAFVGLAYSRYKDAPLYLEWAPGDILERKTPAPDNNEKNSDDVGENDVRRVNLEEQQVKIDPDETESNVLYVTNLKFKTSEESLEKHLTQVVKQGKIQSVKIITHEMHGKKVSKGYGFVEFDSRETATSVCRDAQGSVLDRHALKLRFCEDKPVGKGSDKDNKAGTKLVLKNVHFGVNEKELRQLFSQFGQIKALRLPRRNMGKIAGYAFVEFMTKQEASDAKKALSSTHLYGRHMVLGWAKDNDSMEALRDRSGAKYMDQQNDKPKKRKSSAVVDGSRVKFARRA